MPHNTSIHDLLDGIRKLGCIHKARAYEFELSRWRKTGKLEDTTYIKRIMVVNGRELIELKNPSQ